MWRRKDQFIQARSITSRAARPRVCRHSLALAANLDCTKHTAHLGELSGMAAEVLHYLCYKASDSR